MEEEENDFIVRFYKFGRKMGLPFLEIDNMRRIYAKIQLRRFIEKIMDSFWDDEKMEWLRVAQIVRQLKAGDSKEMIPALRNAAMRQQLEAEMKQKMSDFRKKEAILAAVTKELKEAKAELSECTAAAEVAQRGHAAETLQKHALQTLKAKVEQLEVMLGSLAAETAQRCGPPDPRLDAQAAEALESMCAVADSYQQLGESHCTTHCVAELWASAKPSLEAFSWQQLHSAVLKAQQQLNQKLETAGAAGAAGDRNCADPLEPLRNAVIRAESQLAAQLLCNSESGVQLRQCVEKTLGTLPQTASLQQRDEARKQVQAICRHVAERVKNEALQRSADSLLTKAQGLLEMQRRHKLALKREEELINEIVQCKEEAQSLSEDLPLQPLQLSRYAVRLLSNTEAQANAGDRATAAENALQRLVISGPRELQLFLSLPPGALPQLRSKRGPTLLQASAFPAALRQQLPGAPPVALMSRLVQTMALTRAAQRMVAVLPPLPKPDAPPAGLIQTPAPVRRPAETPASTHHPAETPVYTRRPNETPACTRRPAETPAYTRRLAETPASLPVSSSNPTGQSAAASSQLLPLPDLLARIRDQSQQIQMRIERWEKRMERNVEELVEAIVGTKGLVEFVSQQPLQGAVCGAQLSEWAQQAQASAEANAPPCSECSPATCLPTEDN